MATLSPENAPEQAPETIDGAAPKAPRKARRAALPKEELEARALAKANKAAAKAVIEKLKAVKKAAEPQPEPPTPLQAVGKAIALSAAARRVATLRVPSFQIPAFRMPAVRIPPFKRPRFSRPPMPDFKFTVPKGAALKAAALAVALGLGWLLGAQTYDASARSPQVLDAMASLASRVDEVEAASGRMRSQDLAGMKASLATMQENLEASRAQTHMAIIEFSARVDKLDKETAARMAAAGRQSIDRLERMDREVAARLGEVNRAVAQTAQRIEKLEQRPAPAAASASPAPLPTFAQPAPLAPAAPAAVVAPPAAPPLPPLAIPSETTQVAPTPPRNARASRIPVNGYVLREVRGDGVAVVEGHTGLRQVTLGDAIPGAGTVRAIQKRGGEWVVVTSIGVIDGKAY